MKKMKKVTIHCGESVQDKCREQRHPIKEVEAAYTLITLLGDAPITYSNHPDFVSAIKYIGKKHGVETEFFLNGVSCGNDIEPIFADFNRALYMITELGATED